MKLCTLILKIDFNRKKTRRDISKRNRRDPFSSAARHAVDVETYRAHRNDNSKITIREKKDCI